MDWHLQQLAHVVLGVTAAGFCQTPQHFQLRRSVSPASVLSSSSGLSRSCSPFHQLWVSFVMHCDAWCISSRIPSLSACSMTHASHASFLSTRCASIFTPDPHAMPSDACVCLPDNFTHHFHLVSWHGIQIFFIISYHSDFSMSGPNCLSPKLSNSAVRKKDRCAARCHSIGMSDVSCISHGSLAIGAANSFTTMLDSTSAHNRACLVGQSCSLHDLQTAANFSLRPPKTLRRVPTDLQFPTTHNSFSSPHCLVTMHVPVSCSLGAPQCAPQHLVSLFPNTNHMKSSLGIIPHFLHLFRIVRHPLYQHAPKLAQYIPHKSTCSVWQPPPC